MTPKTKRPTTRRKKSYTAKDFLKTLDNFFGEPDSVVSPDEKRKVWHILTALRGPDNDNDSLKDATTAIIRAKVFVKGRAAVGRHAVIGDPDKAIVWTIFSGSDRVQDHFRNHISSAAKALGIEQKGQRWWEDD